MNKIDGYKSQTVFSLQKERKIVFSTQITAEENSPIQLLP